MFGKKEFPCIFCPQYLKPLPYAFLNPQCHLRKYILNILEKITESVDPSRCTLLWNLSDWKHYSFRYYYSSWKIRNPQGTLDIGHPFCGCLFSDVQRHSFSENLHGRKNFRSLAVWKSLACNHHCYCLLPLPRYATSDFSNCHSDYCTHLRLLVWFFQTPVP